MSARRKHASRGGDDDTSATTTTTTTTIASQTSLESSSSLSPSSSEKPSSNAAAAAGGGVLENPHTLTYLTLGLGVLIYFVFIREHESWEENIRYGLAACVATFLLYCALHVKSIEEAMHRPSVVVWRLTLGIGVSYLLVLVFGLFQRVGDARHFLSFLYPDLGKPLPDRDYASDCRFFTPENPESKIYNVMATVKDEFMLAHVLGYFGKALLWRDYRLVLVNSLLFEVTEVVFQHMMENFKECWWDHLLLDVLGCNLLGMYLGMKTVEYFQMRSYDWMGESNRVKRLGLRVLPEHLDVFEWKILDNAKRFCYVLAVAWIVNCVELYGFFLKYILWVPPKNPMNTIRLLIWLGIGVPALREYYQFIVDPRTKRVGVNTWIALALYFAETLLIVKYGRGNFPSPMPPNIFYPLILLSGVFVIWFTAYFSRKKEDEREKSVIVTWLLRLMVLIMIALLVFIFVSGCPDLEWGKKEFNEFFG